MRQLQVDYASHIVVSEIPHYNLAAISQSNYPLLLALPSIASP